MADVCDIRDRVTGLEATVSYLLPESVRYLHVAARIIERDASGVKAAVGSSVTAVLSPVGRRGKQQRVFRTACTGSRQAGRNGSAGRLGVAQLPGCQDRWLRGLGSSDSPAVRLTRSG
jgi:hypothetical protein